MNGRQAHRGLGAAAEGFDAPALVVAYLIEVALQRKAQFVLCRIGFGHIEVLRDAGQSSFGRNCGHIQPQLKNPCATQYAHR